MISGITRMGSVAVLFLGLGACGGGGGGSGDDGGAISGSWQSGVFRPASTFEAKCASPRSGSSAVTGDPFPDVQGQALDERNWLRSWTNELYLWYDEVPDLNPANYTTLEYFDEMVTSELTASGQPRDKFHFTYPTDEWEAISVAGSEAGYGLQWELIAVEPPRRAVVAYIEPDAPVATSSNVARGFEIVSIDGVDIDTSVNSEIAVLNAALFPADAGETHQFVFRDSNGVTHSVALTSAIIEAASVMNVKTIDTGSGIVGYMQFNTHNFPSEASLAEAFDTLSEEGVVDLVLDIRYNGGGLLDVASEVAYMIAGPSLTAGQTFEEIEFNAKHPTTDPVTGNPLAPTPFHDEAQGFSITPGTDLPTLNLPRAFVLTSAGTCSASESIINGLRGVGVEVIQIGSTTCGKPYGFYPTDNCGTTYFSVQFRGVNAAGFGEYSDGFSPSNTAGGLGVSIPGCSIADDFDHELGDPAELLLASALDYRTAPTCPAPTGQAVDGRVQAQSARWVSGQAIQRPFWRQNRIIR